MRRTFLFLTLCVVVMSTMALAQTAIFPVAASSPPVMTGNEKVGIAAVVRGSVQLVRGGQVGRVVSSGEEIYLGDEVSTDAKGNLQILLLDETAFTIGPSSTIMIDKFIYDPATDAGEVNARILKGTFRFISGKIAHKKPENMQVELPAGTIGIRGTMAMGSVNGMHSLVVLTGPGDKNNTGSKKGEIIVSNEVGSETKSVNIAKTGFGTEIEGEGKAPKTPFLVPAEQLQELSGGLSPESSSESSEDAAPQESESATEQSGQDDVNTGENLSAMESVSELSEAVADESTAASQDAASAIDIEDTISTIAELLTIQTGQYHFHEGSMTLYNSVGGAAGSVSLDFDIDFGDRTVGGGHSNISGSAGNINSNTAFHFDVPEMNFDEGLADSAIFAYSNLPDTLGCATCHADAIFTLNNSDGVIAANGAAIVQVRYGGVTDTGFETTTRESGLSS